MTVLRPNNPIRRLLVACVLMALWLSIMWLLWVCPAVPLFHPHSGTGIKRTCGLLAPCCGSWKYGKVYHLHLVQFGITVALTLFISIVWLRMHAHLVSHPVRYWWRIDAANRVRRGLCEFCGYDVRGADRCPECGRRVLLR